MEDAMKLLFELNEIQDTDWSIQIYDDFRGMLLDDNDGLVFSFKNKDELKDGLDKRVNSPNL